MKKIQINLELEQHLALMLGLAVRAVSADDFSLVNRLTPNGRSQLHEVAQEIIDQVTEKMELPSQEIINAELKKDGYKFTEDGEIILSPATRGIDSLIRKNFTFPKKVGRNDPCTCGSGKKYKHCHGKNMN